MDKDAAISKCGKYRHYLQRRWDDSLPMIQWIMLNPSTTDANNDDPTILKCIKYSKKWGYGGMNINNLFDLRTPYPKRLVSSGTPNSDLNNKYIISYAISSEVTLCAWGNNGSHIKRDFRVLGILKRYGIDLKCLGINKNGTPKHPLYLKSNLLPIRFHT